MTLIEHDINIERLLSYKQTHPDNYNSVIYNENPAQRFPELDDRPDIVGVQSDQELVLLLTEVELIWLRRELSVGQTL